VLVGALIVIDVRESFRQQPSRPAADVIASAECALAGRFATISTAAEVAVNARFSPSALTPAGSRH
jgi:hypothetical protein